MAICKSPVQEVEEAASRQELGDNAKVGVVNTGSQKLDDIGVFEL